MRGMREVGGEGEGRARVIARDVGGGRECRWIVRVRMRVHGGQRVMRGEGSHHQAVPREATASVCCSGFRGERLVGEGGIGCSRCSRLGGAS